MKNIFKILCIILTTAYLTACTSNMLLRNEPIIQKITPYIGQSATVITQQFKLQNIGIAFSKAPKLENNQLIYTFERTTIIPIPTGIATPDDKGKMLQTQMATTSDSIQNRLQCHIIFKLENNIATSYELKGRAC